MSCEAESYSLAVRLASACFKLAVLELLCSLEYATTSLISLKWHIGNIQLGQTRAFFTVISLVLPPQWCLSRNNWILELTPGEFICFDLQFTGLLPSPRVRTSPPKCFCANSSESHRMICSRYTINYQLEMNKTLIWISVLISHFPQFLFTGDWKQLYTWKGNSNCLETEINIVSVRASFLVQTLNGFIILGQCICSILRFTASS